MRRASSLVARLQPLAASGASRGGSSTAAAFIVPAGRYSTVAAAAAAAEGGAAGRQRWVAVLAACLAAGAGAGAYAYALRPESAQCRAAPGACGAWCGQVRCLHAICSGRLQRGSSQPACVVAVCLQQETTSTLSHMLPAGGELPPAAAQLGAPAGGKRKTRVVVLGTGWAAVSFLKSLDSKLFGGGWCGERRCGWCLSPPLLGTLLTLALQALLTSSLACRWLWLQCLFLALLQRGAHAACRHLPLERRPRRPSPCTMRDLPPAASFAVRRGWAL